MQSVVCSLQMSYTIRVLVVWVFNWQDFADWWQSLKCEQRSSYVHVLEIALIECPNRGLPILSLVRQLHISRLTFLHITENLKIPNQDHS